jgi:phenylalanyl-tRNA synthetase alpha chain
MVLFSIPDIRLFWSEDPRFLTQFSAGNITTFKPYSKHPECYKDVSFWTSSVAPDAIGTVVGRKSWHENDFCEVVRDVAGDLVEGVKLVSLSSHPLLRHHLTPIDQIDEFVHPKTQRRSVCYRLNYRSMDRYVLIPSDPPAIPHNLIKPHPTGVYRT